MTAGIFAALDVTTNRLVWRQSWREICYSGSIVTAGGPAVRRTRRRPPDGAQFTQWRQALGVHDRRGVNTTATTFEYHGKQYVVVHAGGGVFANGKRGDGIWMFSLDGKIPSLALGAAPARASAGARPPRHRGLRCR